MAVGSALDETQSVGELGQRDFDAELAGANDGEAFAFGLVLDTDRNLVIPSTHDEALALDCHGTFARQRVFEGLVGVRFETPDVLGVTSRIEAAVRTRLGNTGRIDHYDGLLHDGSKLWCGGRLLASALGIHHDHSAQTGIDLERVWGLVDWYANSGWP